MGLDQSYNLDVQLLKPCLSNSGSQIQQNCVEMCGDYEKINEQLRLSTSTYSPNDESGLQMINKLNGKGCAVMKCSTRCAVDMFNQQCTALSNGKLVGNLIREIIEGILQTHIMDLKVFGLLESVKKESQPECDYLHTPGALFDNLKNKSEETVNMLYAKVLKKQLEVLNKQMELMSRQESDIL